MIVIKVLGTGCPKCNMTKKIVEKVVNKLKLNAKIEMVKDISEIAKYGVMMTPGIVINEKVVTSGRVPREEEVEKWIKEFI